MARASLSKGDALLRTDIRRARRILWPLYLYYPAYVMPRTKEEGKPRLRARALCVRIMRRAEPGPRAHPEANKKTERSAPGATARKGMLADSGPVQQDRQPPFARCESRACGNKQFAASRGSREPATARARAHSPAVSLPSPSSPRVFSPSRAPLVHARRRCRAINSGIARCFPSRRRARSLTRSSIVNTIVDRFRGTSAILRLASRETPSRAERSEGEGDLAATRREERYQSWE